jgi:hypothetical protein
MVTVRIDSNGRELDIKGDVTFIKQVSDIGDITKATSSFTWSLSFPKTPENTKTFNLLGIGGSVSSTPYDKIICQIIYNGFTIEPNGNLIITSTEDEEYKGHVKAGIIDFIQDISNDKISDVIDLSDLNHLNTVNNIINSFTDSLPYKYIVAYYNGQRLANESGVTNLNPFALVPSISIQYLWDKIFEHYGWTYSGNFDLSNTWMTYPNAVVYDATDPTSILTADYPEQTYFEWQSIQNVENPDVTFIDTDFIQESVVNNYEFVIQQAGNYRIKSTCFARANRTITVPPQNEVTSNITSLFRIGVSTEPEQPFIVADGVNEYSLEITATAGTTISIQVRTFTTPFDFNFSTIFGADISVESLGIQEIDFSAALIKLKVKDFFKEIMIRNSLTPFVDVENKAIRFRPLDERLNAPKVNWSNKYVKKGRSEKYVYNNYAQKNIIKHKYNDANEDWADGVLLVDNENQPEEKELYKSFSYAPEQVLVEYNGTNFPSYFVQNFRMFDVEVEQDPDTGDLLANYKQLKDRFYFIRSEQRIDDIYVLGELAEEFPLAIYSEVFADIVFDKYSNMNQLIDNAKIINIDLTLSLADVVMLDFYKRYYFEQEKAYFLLNKLNWKSGNLSSGEFVKINS